MCVLWSSHARVPVIYAFHRSTGLYIHDSNTPCIHQDERQRNDAIRPTKTMLSICKHPIGLCRKGTQSSRMQRNLQQAQGLESYLQDTKYMRRQFLWWIACVPHRTSNRTRARANTRRQVAYSLASWSTTWPQGYIVVILCLQCRNPRESRIEQ